MYKKPIWVQGYTPMNMLKKHGSPRVYAKPSSRGLEAVDTVYLPWANANSIIMTQLTPGKKESW